MDWSEVARSVSERRKDLYISQAVLSSAAGVSEKTVRSVEQGNRAAESTIKRINDALTRLEREREQRGLVVTEVAGQQIVKKVPPEYFDLPDEDKQAIDDMILRLARTRPGE